MADEWITEPGSEPAERIQFDDLGFLADVTHPIRGVLVRRFREPRSVAEVASLLDVPVTRLYHHVNLLLERGLIRTVATRRVGSATEKRYQIVARAFDIAPGFFESTDTVQVAAAIGSLFDFAKLDLQRQVEEGRIHPDDDDQVILSLGELTLSPGKHHDLVETLKAVVADTASDADETEPDAQRVSLFIAAFPTN